MNGREPFAMWYARRFRWFISQPHPYVFLYQFILWLFYGFLWIPVFYLIDAQPAQTSQAYLYHPESLANSQTEDSPAVIPHQIFAAETRSGKALLDLNTASENEILAILDFTPEMTTRLMDMRRLNGGWQTVEQFVLAFGLQPHWEQKIRERCFVSTVESVRGPVDI